jgi:hypothetical protein
MMLVVFITLFVLYLLYESRPIAEEIGGSTHFFLSHGASRNMYLKMHGDGMSQEDLNLFVTLENALLQLEYNSVCTSISRLIEATAASNLIKEKFPKYDFSYHAIHLKQVAYPTRTVNSRIRC